MNLQEDYCSFEVAKLLKEKGFDVPCHYAYHGGIKIPDFHRHIRNFNGEEYANLRYEWYSAPTHQMAMKWLREVHGIWFLIYFTNDEKWDCGIYDVKSPDELNKGVEFNCDTYEGAVELALKYSLENLTNQQPTEKGN